MLDERERYSGQRGQGWVRSFRSAASRCFLHPRPMISSNASRRASIAFPHRFLVESGAGQGQREKRQANLRYGVCTSRAGQKGTVRCCCSRHLFGGPLPRSERTVIYVVLVSRKTLRPSVGVVRSLNHAGDHALRTVHPNVRQLLFAFFAEAETLECAHTLL